MSKTVLKAKKVSVYYGNKQALKSVSLNMNKNEIMALIGPSGCGKSTFLRCLNRMNDTIESCRVEGNITYNDEDIYNPNVELTVLREKIGMVFQKANPFPKSIYDNVIYGAKLHGLFKTKAEADKIVEKSLTRAGLWEEVKDRLDEKGTALSGGQQQRLCIARTIAVSPDVILMDEPCSALDPIATAKIEKLMEELKERYTIVIVTHSMAQAKRISDKTAYFHMGEIVETGETKQIFKDPQNKLTKAYIKGKVG